MVDVATHVRLGLEELASCLLTAGTCDDEPDADAAGYWRLGAPGDAPGDGAGDVLGILAVRRTASATRLPSGTVPPLRRVGDALRTAVPRLDDRAVAFQGCVLTTGDLLATWAVELAVHQLDLAREVDVAVPDPRALVLARRTVEALVGARLPVDDDADAVLLGTGRRSPTPDERRQLGASVEMLPAL